jgi:nuclear RNA export factor
MPQSRVDGDALVISVPTDDVKSILSANGYEFGGINIKIEMLGGRPGRSAPAFSFGNRESSPPDTGDKTTIRECIKAVLSRRYNPETKLLDLSSIGQDLDFNKLGFTGLSETGRSAFFESIMKVCNEVFKTREEKEAAVIAVTLANNGFKEVGPVSLLAQTFQDLKALDLSGNKLSSMDNLSRWRFKFKKLEHIVLTNNSIEENDPTYKRSLARMFPALATIDNAPIPAQDLMNPTPPKVKAAIINDAGGHAEAFITQFFPGFDSNRAAMVPYYYDADSKFSYAINMKSLRDPSEPKVIPKGEWSSYIRDSRNLSVLNNPHAKIERLHHGVDDITKAFSTFPATIHPPFGEKWLIECNTMPNLPDPTGASPIGVNGLRLVIHGEFQEVETQKRRSFDRTFILGPGGPNGIRVLNDMMTIRGYGGYSAFQPDPPEPEAVQEGPAPTEEQQKQAWVMELSKITGMNVQFSLLCMEESNWVPSDAIAKFEMSRDAGQIPAEAFVH